jgi:hypothetical protein
MGTKSAKATITIEVVLEDGTVDSEAYEADVAHLNEIYNHLLTIRRGALEDLYGMLTSLLDRVDPMIKED